MTAARLDWSSLKFAPPSRTGHSDAPAVTITGKPESAQEDWGLSWALAHSAGATGGKLSLCAWTVYWIDLSPHRWAARPWTHGHPSRRALLNRHLAATMSSSVTAANSERPSSVPGTLIPMSDSAAAPILATKFFAPRWRAGQVSRPRLTARLTSSTQSKLTLVSAPAGFGKTTLAG